MLEIVLVVFVKEVGVGEEVSNVGGAVVVLVVMVGEATVTVASVELADDPAVKAVSATATLTINSCYFRVLILEMTIF